MNRIWLSWLICGALLWAAPCLLYAQEADSVPMAEEPPPAEPPTPAESPASPLLTRQQQVAERFRELERLLLRMAELTAPTDPRRAALLRQAVAQSKQRAIDDQFETLLDLIKQQRLSAAVKGQGDVQADLVKLLELLLSEDRSKRIESEKEQVREYLKRVNQIIKEQKSVQNATQRESDPNELADRQGDLSEKTGKLADDLRQDHASTPDKQSDPPRDGEETQRNPEESSPADSDAEQSGDKKSDAGKSGADKKDGDKNASDPKSSDGKKSDSEKSDVEKSDVESDSQDRDAKPDADKSDSQADKKDGDQAGDKSDTDAQPAEGDQSKPAEGAQESEPSQATPPSDSAPSEPSGGESQDGKPPVDPPQPGEQDPSQQNPAQQRLQKAQQRMQEAKKKLEEAQRDEAVERQEEALRELEQAKADLEEILRQLREEEMARMLAMLEARFRKMLDVQVLIYEGTQRLDNVPAADRDRDDEIEAGRLSRKEAELAVEADKALTLLREEGSAVAFPEAVVEIRDDMLSVRDRLAEANVGEITQNIEQDIITALEEMITALEKAQKDLQDQKQQPSPPMEGGGENEMPLVDTLAELKMIRALQMRVNNRTQRYAELTESEQADQPELLAALRQLAEREQRIHKITRDIVLGRNR